MHNVLASSQNAKRWVAITGCLLLLGTSCGGEADTSAAGSEETGLAGEIAIDGSSTVFPIAQAVAEDFQIENPEVKVSVGLAGTGGGFEAFCAGETDISNASRPIEEEEADCLNEAGISFTEFQIGVDGLAVATHPGTDWVDCMTFEELKMIYEPGSQVQTWKDVNPAWPAEPLRIFGPDPDSGSYDYFAEEVADPDAEEPATRDDMTQSADDNVLVQGVQGEPGSIGYFGFAYYVENQQGLKVIQVDGGEGCVEPSADTVKSNEYPLSRPLFFYVSNKAVTRPEVATYVDFWINSAAEFASAVGYIEAPHEAELANRQALEKLAG